MMNPEIKELWVAALESGEYQQCQNVLTTVAEDGSKTHCCLGVLTDLAVKAGVIKPGVEVVIVVDEGASDRTVLSFEGPYTPERTIVPYTVRVWAGLSEGNPDVEYGGTIHEYSLATLNDGITGTPLAFTEIAQIIREQL